MKTIFCFFLSLLFTLNVGAADLALTSSLGGSHKSSQYVDITSSLAWSPASKDFGSVNTGSTADQIFTVACQAGGGDCEEITNSKTGDAYSIQETTCATAPYTLLAGESCTVTVRYTAGTGAQTGSLVAAWTNQTNVTAALSGTGVNLDPPTTPVISVTPGDTQNVIALTSGGTGATSYNLLWGLSTGDLPNTITGATLPYTHTGRTNGTPYYYVLNAINANGTTASSEVSGTPAASSFTDNFNRAAGALGINWTNLVGTLLIGSSSAANSVVASAATPSYAIWSANTLNDNQYSQITFSAANDGTRGTCVRLSGATATGYCLISVTTSRTDIMRYNSGGGTVLTSITGMAAYVGKTGKITVSGSNPVVVTAYLDGSQIGTYSDSSASRVATGAPGIMSRETYGPLIDNFEAGNL